MFYVRVGKNDYKVRTLEDYDDIIVMLSKKLSFVWKKIFDNETNTTKRKYFLNMPVSFDIETSSFYNLDGIFYTNESKDKSVQNVGQMAFDDYLKKHPDDEEGAENKRIAFEKRAQEKFKRCSCMYVWQMAFGTDEFEGQPLIVVGRTWDEWLEFMYDLHEHLQLNENRAMIIYSHNLSYEHGFIQNFFKWED